MANTPYYVIMLTGHMAVADQSGMNTAGWKVNVHHPTRGQMFEIMVHMLQRPEFDPVLKSIQAVVAAVICVGI